MTSFPPLTQKEIVDEIIELTGLPSDLVERKVAQEFRSPNSLILEAADQKIDSFVYNEKMEAFYKETDIWIFSLAVEFSRWPRRRMFENVQKRFARYLQNLKDFNGKIRVLMLGDGIGSDTIALFNLYGDQAEFYYLDVPGSKTFDFAVKRFKKYSAYPKILIEFDNIPKNFFDMVICLEVLEHLPDPLQSIHQIAEFLKSEGCALVSECFLGVTPQFPTHLKSNLRYAGRTPFLFLSQGLCLTYFCTHPLILFKPMEFLKKSSINSWDRLRVYLNPIVLLYYIYVRCRIAVQRWLSITP
ncbi:MAG TPA: methyltransferase [Candidatus Omnitrophota bacterium]|nr:methyltransferase [Candidatus Omnitrophota bacterium]